MTINHAFFNNRLTAFSQIIDLHDLKKYKNIPNECHKLRSELGVYLIFPALVRKSTVSYYHQQYNGLPEPTEEIVKLVKAAMDILKVMSEAEVDLLKPHVTYIPTLRGSIQLFLNDKNEIVSDSVYSDTIAKNYGLLAKNRISLSTGLDLYSVIKKLRNSRKEIRTRFDAFERFLSANFFHGKPIDIVALEDERTIQVWIEDNQDRELHHLGDGIQAIMNLMYPIFMCDDKEWLFIEEPEVHLHPGFQTLFMNTILNNDYLKKKDLRFYITSHSNHLLDTSLLSTDVSIYTMAAENQNGHAHSIIRQVEGGDIDILDSLGVANSSLFLAQCSIWVEGVTDRLLLGSYLEALMRERGTRRFNEDLNFCFFEYAGSNVRHYLFSQEDAALDRLKRIRASSIANRIWILADQDSVSQDEKQTRHEKLFGMNSASFMYSTTGALEIENTLPWSILANFLKEELGLDQKDIGAKKISTKAYRNKRLGTFLQSRFKGTALDSRKLSGSGGALSTYYKNKLAEYVYRGVHAGRFDFQLIKENADAERLVRSLHKFLDANCPR